MHGFCSCHQGIHLDHLALVARGPCVPESHKTITIRDGSWQTIFPRALYRQQTETDPKPFYEKGLPAFPEVPDRRAGFRFYIYLEAREVFSGNTGQRMPFCTFPLTHYSSLLLPRKELIH